MIESCDNELNNSNNSDNESEDVIAVLNDTNSDKVKESHLNENGLADEVAEKLTIKTEEDKPDSCDHYNIDGSSKGCNVEVAEVTTGSNRNSVELKVN